MNFTFDTIIQTLKMYTYTTDSLRNDDQYCVHTFSK